MLPSGKSLDILFKDESSYGVQPGGNWTRTFIYSHGLEQKEPLEDDPLLGLPRVNNRDATSQAPGLPTHDGPVVVPLCLNHIGYWLKLGLGGPTTDATGIPDFVHTFLSGAETLPSRAFEIKTPLVGSTAYPRHLGNMLNRFSLQVSRAGNYARMTIDLVGKREVDPLPTATAAGTPATALALDRILNRQGIFKIAGAQADIMAINATYDNKLKPIEGPGDEFVQGYDSDEEAQFSGTIRLRLKTAAFKTLGDNKTLSTAEILYQRSSTRLLSLATSNMLLERKGLSVDGPGAIEQTYNFRCQQDAANPMLTVLLKNAQPAASYA